MTTSDSAVRQRIWPFAIAAGFVALTTFYLLHRVSIRVTPDGWAYWQGATSILEGRGFRFFSGEPIVTWQPLYSLYLLPWIALLGSTTIAVAAANGALMAAQAAAWTLCVLRVAQDDTRVPSIAARAGIAAYFGVYLPLNLAFVRADLPMYALLPVFLLAMWRTATAARPALSAALAAGMAMLMVATHHRSFLFIGAAVAVLLAAAAIRKGALARIAPPIAGVILAPLVAWLVLRQWLGQWDSHLVAIGGGREAFVDSLRQLVRSTGDLLSGGTVDPPRLAVLAFAAVLAYVLARDRSKPLRVATLFVTTALVLTMVVFAVVYLEDDVDPRFVLFVPGILVPFAILAIDATTPRLLGVAVAAFVLPLAIGANAAIREAGAADPLDTSEVVTHPARITSSYADGPAVFEPGRPRLIAPDQSAEPDQRIRDRRK